MPKPTSTQPRAFSAFRATAMIFGGSLMATLLLPFGCSPSDQGPDPAPVLSDGDSRAMAEPDFSPWDGPAFGLWIPADTCGGRPDSWIYVRIWNAPEESEREFVFPDGSLRLGAATYLLDLEHPHAVDWSSHPRLELKGRVRFIKANRGQPVVGELDFVSEEGALLKGRFHAHWRNEGWVERAEQGNAADAR